MCKNLWELLKNESCHITGFSPELSDDFRTRLIELGFFPGETVTCKLGSKLGAPRIYQVNNTCYSLDDQVAKLIETKLAA